jgi:hypothetical protein
VILRGLHRATAWLYALLLDSMLGRYLTGYRTTSEAFAHSRLRRLFQSKRKRSDRLIFRIRHRISSVVEKSLFCRLVSALEHALLQCSVNDTFCMCFLSFHHPTDKMNESACKETVQNVHAAGFVLPPQSGRTDSSPVLWISDRLYVCKKGFQI